MTPFFLKPDGYKHQIQIWANVNISGDTLLQLLRYLSDSATADIVNKKRGGGEI